MEGPKHFIVFLILMSITVAPAFASRKKEIYQAYINDHMDRWQNIIDKMEQEKIEEVDFLSQLVNFQYGYIGWCIGNDKTEPAKEYLERAEQNLKLLSKEDANPSIIHAYESAFYGFKIGLSRLRAPFYGPRSIKHAELAIELDKENPLGYIQYGNSQFYMPPIFGGSKSEAIKYFQKAQELMERNPERIKTDWNYLSLLTLIAQSFEEMEQYKQAQDYYEKTLKVEPNFSWVKNELYPSLLQKMNNQR